jgi:hypothetical protein
VSGLLSVFGSGGGDPSIVVNVKTQGADNTGAVDCRAIIESSWALAAALGGCLYFPPGTYRVDRNGANSYCIDAPAGNVTAYGVRGLSWIKNPTSMPNASVSMIRVDSKSNIVFRDLGFDGNWGNKVTHIASGSHDTAANSGTIYLDDVTNIDAPGTVKIRLDGDVPTYVSYTGVDTDAKSLTGCTGGLSSGRLAYFDPVVYEDSATGINHTTQTDPKNHGIMLRGADHIDIVGCQFKDMYGDAIWMGTSVDDDLFNWTRDCKVLDCTVDTTARNAISFGAAVERIEIAGNVLRNIWTCGIDSEPQGFNTPNRDVWIHHNYIESWPIWPGGGQGQAIGAVAGTPAGYNHASAARGWRIHDNTILGWTALNSCIDVQFVNNHCRTRFDFIATDTIESVSTGADTFTLTAHGLITGNGPIRVYTTVAAGLPAGVSEAGGDANALRSIEYWVIKVDANTIKITTSFANAIAGTGAVNLTDVGSGTLTIAGPSTIAPVFIDHTTDDYLVTHNWIYDNSKKSENSGDANNGAICVQHYPADGANYQPKGGYIAHNRIRAHKGVHGIWVNSQGGYSVGDGTSAIAPSTGTATGVTASTMTNSGASWPVAPYHQWIGWQVIMGGCVATIADNTATVLTLRTPEAPVGVSGWRTPLGEWAPVPTAGAYTITQQTGVLNICDNLIDNGAYGSHTAGGYGIYLFNDRAGGRIRIDHNEIKNWTTWGIFIAGATSKPILSLDLTRNYFYDDQSSVTGSAAIRFNDAQSLTSIGRLRMSDNTVLNSITPLSNVAAGAWLVTDGPTQQWAGYATPESAVTAPIGSQYVRLDGGASTTLYIKESGTGNTGWTAK